MSKIEKTVEDLAAPIAAAAGLRIYDVEYKKEGPDWFLRVFLYGETGVTLDDCETVSRALSDVLDQEDPIQDAYCLEVSSPGLERILKRPWHFETAIGEWVEVRLYAPLDGKKSLQGTLRHYGEDGIIIETEEDQELKLAHGQIAQVRTVFSGTSGKD